jgi:two-component system chemotaxis response regulator CheY
MPSNVLIVDDSPAMRKVIRRVLSLSGFETRMCLEAGDGLEALAVLQRVRVGVILTDINMPNMNGEELIEALSIHAVLKKIPVVVISTDRSEERLQRMMALGAKGYVTKPFVPETLGAIMAKIAESA